MTASITADIITIAATVKICFGSRVEVVLLMVCSGVGVVHSMLFSRGYIIQESSENCIDKTIIFTHTTLHVVFFNKYTNFTIVNLDKVTVSSQLREKVCTGTVFTMYVTYNCDIIALSGRHF